MEQELTIKDMLVIVLKKAKSVLAWTLIFGVLVGGFGMYRSYDTAEDAAETEKTVTLEEYERSLEMAEKALSRAQRQVERMQAYLNESLYYSIDPYEKSVCELLFYVDTGYEINPELSYQSPDRTGHVVAAYTQLYKYDEDIIGGIYEKLNKELDKKYVLELIEVTDEGNNLVKICVTHEDAAVASDIAHYIYEEMEKRIQATVAPHTTEMLSDYAGYEIDTAMGERHDNSETDLENAQLKVTEKQAALDEIVNNPVTAADQEASLTELAGSGIKYGAVGLVAGFVAGCGIALAWSIFGGRLQNAAEAAARYKFSLLGVLPQDRKGRWFDGWIRSLEGEPKLPYGEAAQVAAANISAVTGDKRVLLVSTGDGVALARFAESTGKQIKIGGNIIADAAAVQALSDVDGVVLLEERDKAGLEQVDAEVTRLEAMGKEIFGLIVA